MDAISRLIAAIAEARARMGGGGRMPGKGKKNKKTKVAPRAPAKTGPSAGCGTGAGGFKAGNNCAKEDGIPRKPLGQGGALKKADAKADIALAKKLREKAKARKERKEALDKAKSEAARPAKEAKEKQRKADYLKKKAAEEKQRRIDGLRAEAAKRAEAKKKREINEYQLAVQRAGAKRDQMLQRIRIKKANEQLNVVEKPEGRFTGRVDQAATKNPGETQFDFAKRRISADLKKLHEELDAIEKRADEVTKSLNSKLQQLKEEAASIVRDRQAFAGKITNGSRRPTKDEAAEYDRMSEQLTSANSKIREVEKQKNEIAENGKQEQHDVISEFVQAHGKGSISVKADSQFGDPDGLAKTTSEYAEKFKENARKAWGFLSRTVAPIYQSKAESIKVRLDTKQGGADYNDVVQEARHGTKGQYAEYNTSDHVIVHEIAHGLHYGRSTIPADPNDRLSLPKTDRVAESIRDAIKEDYDARVSAFKASYNGDVKQVSYHPERTQYKLWVPKSETRMPLSESYLGYANQYADSEHGSAIKATEVVSVGIENVYLAPRAFRSRARSHFDLMMVFMAGRLH